MACMEHECRDCAHFWADNTTALYCPKCGGRVTNSFDDYDNYGDDDGFWDDDRDDDPEDFWRDIGRP